MRIIIGGSGSTGSSLLKNVLSRHSVLFSGSETSLFTKKELYRDFNANKNRIGKRFPRGLKSHSYHLYNGIDLLHAEYNHSQASIDELLKNSKDFQSFTDNYFSAALGKFKKQYWIEKTPGNAFLFQEFLKTFDESRVIHIVRNPVDSIASLLRRGNNILYACGIYLLNNAAALESECSSNYIRVSYEELVDKPEKCIGAVCEFLGVEFEEKMLEAGNIYGIMDTRIDGWENDEMDVILAKKKSVTPRLEEEIYSALAHINISSSGKKLFGIRRETAEEIIPALGYSLKPFIKNNINKQLLAMMLKDRTERLIKMYPTGINYPLRIIK
jgi:hypothetical protein